MHDEVHEEMLLRAGCLEGARERCARERLGLISQSFSYVIGLMDTHPSLVLLPGRLGEVRDVSAFYTC